MATIRRNSRHLGRIFATARNIKGHSLGNNFAGQELTGECIDPLAWPKEIKHVTPQEYLAHTFVLYSFTRLSRVGNKYHLTVHSNEWYEFEADV